MRKNYFYLLLIFTTISFSQSLVLDPTFVTGTGFTQWSGFGTVTLNRTIVQPDGKIIAVGQFINFNGSARSNIVRLHSNGTLDTSFSTGTSTNAGIWDCALQADGKIIIVGGFSSYNGSPTPRIARLNANGTLDTTFTIGSGPNDWIENAVLQPDGKLIVVGSFITVNGVPRARVARLNTNGTLDTSFNVGTGADARIRDVALQSDGKIIIVGDISTFNGIATKRMARLNSDGSFDPTFNVGIGPLSNVWTVAIQADQKIIIGGEFQAFNNIASYRLARVNSDGTFDPSFSVGNGFSSNATSILIQDDGKVIVGGTFTTYKGVNRARIARINTDGSLDTSFTVGTGFDAWVSGLTRQPDGKLLVCGQFLTFNGNNSVRIARLVDTTLANDDFNQNTISVYPNPVSSVLYVESSIGTFDTAEIYDMTGRTVFATETFLNEIDTRYLPKGIYILALNKGTKTFRTRFMKL